MSENYLVIDIGGTFTKYALMDADCHILEKSKVPTAGRTQETFVDMLAGLYEKYRGEVAGIAISSAGMIDSARGFMYNAGSILSVADLPLAKVLSERCGVPVTVENDARCAGLAEIWRGSLADCRNAIAMIIGTAVGGAVIVDRRILRGMHCMAGEFSYILTDATDAENPERNLALCGGMPALLTSAERALGVPEGSLSGEEVFRLAGEDDERIICCVRAFARELAVQITNCQFIFDPERIAIGGGVSEQKLLIDMIREELVSLNGTYPHPVPLPKICACRFHNDSNLIGALYTHLESQKITIDLHKVTELLEMVGDRREGRYLKQMLAAQT